MSVSKVKVTTNSQRVIEHMADDGEGASVSFFADMFNIPRTGWRCLFLHVDGNNERTLLTSEVREVHKEVGGYAFRTASGAEYVVSFQDWEQLPLFPKADV